MLVVANLQSNLHLLGRDGGSLPHQPKICSSSQQEKFGHSRLPQHNFYYHSHSIPFPSTKNFILSCSYCRCNIFILTSYFLYTKIMLILIFICIQYLQNFVFSFEKGLNDQNHSSSNPLDKKSSPAKFPIPQL